MTFFPRDAPEKRGAAALLGSALVHGAVLGGLALHSSLLPQSALLMPLHFSGQTFDIDALGAPTEDDAAPASPAAASLGATSAELSPHQAEERQVVQPEAEPGPFVEPNAPPSWEEDSSAPQAQDPPEDTTAPRGSTTEPQAEFPATAPAKSDSPQPRPPTDPFDLGVPGEPTRSSSSPAQPAPGAYGQNGGETTTVDLFAAFLKTLPLAAKTDPAWLRTPAGKLGEIDIIVTVDESGQLLPIQIIKPPASLPPPLLERAVLQNRKFLLHGRFALSSAQPSGSQRLRLSAVVESRPADENHPDADGVRAFGLHGGWPPTGTYFTYFSGKHVEIRMQRLP